MDKVIERSLGVLAFCGVRFLCVFLGFRARALGGDVHGQLGADFGVNLDFENLAAGGFDRLFEFDGVAVDLETCLVETVKRTHGVEMGAEQRAEAIID